MTAAEIKKKLEPFANFAPAILAAAEIVEAAENAQRDLKNFDKQREAIEEAIADAEARRIGAQERLIKISEQVEAEILEFKNKETEREQLIKKQQVEIDNILAKKKSILEEIEGEKLKKRQEIAALEKDYVQLKQSFDAFKQAHGL